MTQEHSKAEDDEQEYYAQHPYEEEVLIDFWTEVASNDWKPKEGTE